MNQVQVEQKSYQMPPQDGFTVAYFLTVADIERSARAKGARLMKNTEISRKMLAIRPPQPGLLNGRLQVMARRLLDFRGHVTVREVVEYAYAHRLLLGK